MPESELHCTMFIRHFRLKTFKHLGRYLMVIKLYIKSFEHLAN